MFNLLYILLYKKILPETTNKHAASNKSMIKKRQNRWHFAAAEWRMFLY